MGESSDAAARKLMLSSLASREAETLNKTCTPLRSRLICKQTLLLYCGGGGVENEAEPSTVSLESGSAIGSLIETVDVGPGSVERDLGEVVVFFDLNLELVRLFVYTHFSSK